MQQADAAWFDRHLTPDFLNTNPDGSLVDRAAFLAQIARGQRRDGRWRCVAAQVNRRAD